MRFPFVKIKTSNFIVSGGGRKNKTLIDKIFQFMNNKKLILKNIDKFKINGDFVESQAFAFLAVRSFLQLPISFPNTTNCKVPCTGGEIARL